MNIETETKPCTIPNTVHYVKIEDFIGEKYGFEPNNCNKDYNEDVCDGCEFRDYELVGHPGGGCDGRVSVEKSWCELGYWNDDF